MADISTPQDIRVFYPETDAVEVFPPRLRAFCDYCLSVKRPGSYAERRHFDFAQMRRWLGFIIIVGYVPTERDFRYRLYGSEIAKLVGFDVTGVLVSEIAPGLSKFITRIYRECVDEKKLIYTEHTRVYPRFSRNWHRVLCPVLRDEEVQVVTCSIAAEMPKRPA